MSNPQKDFRYVLELNGADAFLIQEVTPPTPEFAVVTHGAPVNMPDKKTPGKVKFGQLVLTKLKPADRADSWAWDWFAKCLVGTYDQFAYTGFLKELGPDGVTVVRKYYLNECWPSKIDPGKYTSTGSNNVIETVTLEVNSFFPNDSAQWLQLFGGAAVAAAGAAASMGRQ